MKVFVIIDGAGKIVGVYSSQLMALRAMNGLFAKGIDAKKFRIEKHILDEVA